MAVELGLDVVREITAADLVSEARPKAPAENRLKKIRDTHHALARALAGGMLRQRHHR
jgi:hypothetical protein